jgi:hypothetical protein
MWARGGIVSVRIPSHSTDSLIDFLRFDGAISFIRGIVPVGQTSSGVATPFKPYLSQCEAVQRPWHAILSLRQGRLSRQSTDRTVSDEEK